MVKLDRKGIAMESAILFMVVIFSLCTLLLSVSLIGRTQTRIDKNLALSQVGQEQMGENFLIALQNGEPPATYETEKYACTTATTPEGRYTLTVRLKDTNATVLYVEAAKEGDTVRVHRWSKTTP